MDKFYKNTEEEEEEVLQYDDVTDDTVFIM